MTPNADELAQNENVNQFIQLAQYIPMAVAMFDTDMRYLFANQRWLTDYGLDQDSLIGKSHYDVFQEISNEWKAIHQRCLGSEIHRDSAVLFPRFDGSTDWIRREIRPWHTSNGVIGGLLMYTEVITERKQAQDALQAQHTFLRQVIDLNTSFIFAKDEEGRYTLVNKALADHYGSVPEEMVGKYDEDYNPKSEETGHFRRDDRQVIQSREPKFIPEEPVSNALTGETRWYQTIKVPLISEDNDSVQLLGIATDITERKQAQDALQAQHTFLRQVIDLNTSFIFAKDEEGRYTLVNKALADHYGSVPEEMVGKYDEDYNPKSEETEHFRRDDRQVIQSREPKFIPEEPVSNALTGETRWYQTIKVPLISEVNESVQLLGIATDITERKQAEVQLQTLVIQEQKARREAEAAAEMKDLFLANMSHELRTPMNAIIGFLREMLYSGQLNQDNNHMAERCLANSKRLLLLINSVLDLSRLASGSLEIFPDVISPTTLAQMTLADLQVQAKEKGLTLNYEIDSSLPQTIIHDEERLTQIITNLLVNAIKFTNSGTVKLYLKQQKSRLIIQVSDTGIGIPQNHHKQIFEDFVQLDATSRKRYGGAGLGLSIVKSLVDLMDGTVSVESEVGQYTVFTVDIPMTLPNPSVEESAL